jgi:hypothetical protein
MQDDSAKLDDFEHFRVVPHTGGISVKIEGRRRGKRDDGSDHPYEPILDQAIKKGSGPMKGFASTTKAPFLTKKDKGKALVAPNQNTAPARKAKAPVMAAPVAPAPKKKRPVDMDRAEDDGFGAAIGNSGQSHGRDFYA